MGQCMSRKAAGAFAASAAAAHNRPTKMNKKHLKSPDDENNKESSKKHAVYSKGVATSFGFKRRPTTAPIIAPNAGAARRLANADNIIDRNGNGDTDFDTDPLTSNAAPTGRSTPRLVPPKKEANATRVSRFGFRQPQVNRLNKVSDLNTAGPLEFANNNNAVKPRPNSTLVKPKIRSMSATSTNNVATTDNNRNRMTKPGIPQSQVGKFMLHSVQLPQPEMPVRILESKTAKTLANNSKKVASSTYHQGEDNVSSKEGSLTEDSGVGSHFSNGVADLDNFHGVEHLDSSPTFGARRLSYRKQRNLEMVVTGNKFDIIDLDDSPETCGAPLPQLPSAFHVVDNRSSYHNNGIVKERSLDYQRHLEMDNRRKHSLTSSEGFSDDYCEEEKSFKDRFKSEKTFIKPTHKSFLKVKLNIKDDSSTQSSDEHEWTHGGEAMADEISFSLSSSDESKERDQRPISFPSPNIGPSLHSIMAASISNSFPKADVKNVLLTIQDPKFAAVAAVAASSNIGTMLDEETSPVDSLISCSESEELLKKKPNRSSSESKDINEKLTLSSPGTPTNASNSLSLSDGKDDFLIDDEIADQPALVFEDTMANVNDNTFSISQSNSETTQTQTMVDSTPKPRRRNLGIFEGSPLLARSKKLLSSRTGSLDTLSPCESIASDDLMLDYEYSQSSGLEDFDRTDRQSSGYPSMDETCIMRGETDKKDNTMMRDWSALLGNCSADKTPVCTPRTSRLLRSRTGTPNSIPDSPRSLDRQVSNKARPPSTSSPLKPRRSAALSEYDSDDSLRLDRANQAAIKQDMMSIKTMLLKLRRVLNEQVDEDILLRSETHNPFNSQLNVTNGLFNGLSSNSEVLHNEEGEDSRMELAELRKQVLFLQGQLEDKEKTVQCLQEQMVKLANDNYSSNSAPASTTVTEQNVSNAATQTERIRPISAGPSLVNGSSVDGGAGSLVSVNETSTRKSRPQVQCDSPSSSRRTPSRLWRKPGEPPSPPRYTTNTSSIPRRANSRTRAPSTQS